MDFNSRYAQELLRNYPGESDSVDSDKPHFMVGGDTQIIEKDQPNGGFPPIYLCEKMDPPLESNEDEKPKRGYSPPATTVSIKSIMEKRRKATPIS